MEQNLKIALDKCIKCGACIRNCPTKVIEMTPAGVQEQYPPLCIACGQCVAVCPVDAVQHLKMENDFTSIQNSYISYEQFHQFGRNRRSIRNFKIQPVEKETLEKVLNAVRYIPTGGNAQELQYLVISDPKRLTAIRDAMYQKAKSKFLRAIQRLIGGKKAKYINSMVDRFTIEEDVFLRSAPTLVIIYIKQKTAMGRFGLDAGIAGHHINLACETLGLGACWIGFHTIFCHMFRSVAKASLIPEGCKVVGSIAIGYPAVKYYKTCARKPLKTTWI